MFRLSFACGLGVRGFWGAVHSWDQDVNSKFAQRGGEVQTAVYLARGTSIFGSVCKCVC